MRRSKYIVAISAIMISACGTPTTESPTTSESERSSNERAAVTDDRSVANHGYKSSLDLESEKSNPASAADEPSPELESVLAIFPPGSDIPDMLRKCMSSDEEAQSAAIDQLEALEERMAAGKLHADEVRGLLLAYADVPFPQPEIGFGTNERLSFALYDTPTEHAQNLVDEIKPRYAVKGFDRRNTLLVMLCASESLEGAEAFVECIETHGWPQHTYPRVFWEFGRLSDHATTLFPKLLLTAEGEVAYYLSEALIETDPGMLTPKHLESLIPTIQDQLPRELVATRRYQAKPNSWQSEEYWEQRNSLVTYLRLASRTIDPSVDRSILEAISFADSEVALEAVRAALQRELALPDDVIERLAADHLVRSELYHMLDDLGRLELFPAEYRSWDAFAAAEMVGWLNHPAELGRPPAELEKEKVVRAGSGDDAHSLYIWRFREEPGSPWLVGISGPYELKGQPKPIHGHLTFSQFTPWKDATPEEHVTAIVSMFEEFMRDDR